MPAPLPAAGISAPEATAGTLGGAGTYIGADGQSHQEGANPAVTVTPPTPTPSPATQAAQQTETTNNTAANNLTTNTTTSNGNPFISTSDSIQQKEDATTGVVNNLNANNAATTDAHNVYIQTLQQEQANLTAQNAMEVESINKDFDAQAAALKTTQTGETAQEANIQQRSGGYLGQGASQTGALISLNQTHISEQGQLESKRQAAVQAANDAIDAKQYVVAESLAKEAKDYAAAIKQNQQDYLDNQIKIQQSQQSAQDAAQKTADNSLKAFSMLTPDEVSKIDPSQLTKIDQAYGVPGFAINYIKVTSAANAAKSQTDLVDAQQKMLTLLQDIPAGKKVTFPDPTNPGGPGTTYTGMGKTGDISTFSETDNNGNVTVIAYNRGSGSIVRTPVGKVGKEDASNQDAEMLAGPTKFLQSVGVPIDPSNPNSPKQVTASDYVAGYQQFIQMNPGQGAKYIANFPLQETVLNSQLNLAKDKLQGDIVAPVK